MKIVCVPLGTKILNPANYDLNVVLYGKATESDESSIGATVFIGATVLKRIKRSKLSPEPYAWDLLSIALSVIAADTGVKRKMSPDGWTRELDLVIAVNDPVFWSKQANLLEKQLKFLTTDIWQLSFIGGGLLPASPNTPSILPQECVSLLSGGLDSFVGGINLEKQGLSPYFVSQVSRGDKSKQISFARGIGGGLRPFQLNHNVKCTSENERSQRARSIIFLAYGTLLATSLEPYKNGKEVALYVCENGYISINPPLTGARVGSLSTRTTHPVFLDSLQKLLDSADLRVKVENPYQFKTKGEMLSECADQGFLREHAYTTTSCARFGRNGFVHCGRCLPCLIRRSSFHAWGIKDKTHYVYGDLSKDDEKHARFDDVRSAAMAVAEAQSGNFDYWIRPSLNSVLLGNVTPYKEVVQRGLDELGAFLKFISVI